MPASNNTYKVGPRGRLVTIPEGFIKVEEGCAKKGDWFANTVTAYFEMCEDDDVGMEHDTFDLLIRSTNPKYKNPNN